MQEMDTNLECDVTADSGLPSARIYCLGLKFKVCKSVHHHTIQIDQRTRCNNFSSLLLDVYLPLNMFRASSRPSSELNNCSSSLRFYRWSVVVAVLLVVVGPAPKHVEPYINVK